MYQNTWVSALLQQESTMVMRCLASQHESVNRGHTTSDIMINVQNGIPFHEHKAGDFVSICQSPYQQESVVCQTTPQSDAASVLSYVYCGVSTQSQVT